MISTYAKDFFAWKEMAQILQIKIKKKIRQILMITSIWLAKNIHGFIFLVKFFVYHT
jgi:hypothetical protein